MLKQERRQRKTDTDNQTPIRKSLQKMGRIEDMYMVEIAININNEITFDKKKRGLLPNPYRHMTQYTESKRVPFHIVVCGCMREDHS